MVKRISGKLTFLLIITPVALLVVANFAGLRLNYSHSVKGRLWQEVRKDNYYRGDYVFICIQDKNVIEQIKPYLLEGECGGSVGLLKKIVGVSGDTVSFSSEGISINKVKIDNSLPLDRERLLHKLEPYKASQIIPHNYVVVVGETFDSLDSRYFGPIHKKWITGKALKLL